MAMERLRDNTQPDCLSLVRTSVQSSRTTGFFASSAFLAASSLCLLAFAAAVLSLPAIRSAESSSQFTGALGGAGGGGNLAAARSCLSFFCFRLSGCGRTPIHAGGCGAPFALG